MHYRIWRTRHSSSPAPQAGQQQAVAQGCGRSVLPQHPSKAQAAQISAPRAGTRRERQGCPAFAYEFITHVFSVALRCERCTCMGHCAARVSSQAHAARWWELRACWAGQNVAFGQCIRAAQHFTCKQGIHNMWTLPKNLTQQPLHILNFNPAASTGLAGCVVGYA